MSARSEFTAAADRGRLTVRTAALLACGFVVAVSLVIWMVDGRPGLPVWGPRGLALVFAAVIVWLPVVFPGPGKLGLSFGVVTVLWWLSGAAADWGPAALATLALHAALIVWCLLAQMPARTVVHGSALRLLGRRFVLAQLLAQAVLALGFGARTLPDSLPLALVGIIAAVLLGAWFSGVAGRFVDRR